MDFYMNNNLNEYNQFKKEDLNQGEPPYRHNEFQDFMRSFFRENHIKSHCISKSHIILL